MGEGGESEVLSPLFLNNQFKINIPKARFGMQNFGPLWVLETLYILKIIEDSKVLLFTWAIAVGNLKYILIH